MSVDEVEFITFPCIRCGKREVLHVSQSGWKKWKEGAFIQDAFPDLPVDEREQMMTGTHPECWKEMFPDDEA